MPTYKNQHSGQVVVSDEPRADLEGIALWALIPDTAPADAPAGTAADSDEPGHVGFPLPDDAEGWATLARRLGLTVGEKDSLEDTRAAAIDFVRPAGNEGTDKWIAYTAHFLGLTFPTDTPRKAIIAAAEAREQELGL